MSLLYPSPSLWLPGQNLPERERRGFPTGLPRDHRAYEDERMLRGAGDKKTRRWMPGYPCCCEKPCEGTGCDIFVDSFDYNPPKPSVDNCWFQKLGAWTYSVHEGGAFHTYDSNAIAIAKIRAKENSYYIATSVSFYYGDYTRVIFDYADNNNFSFAEFQDVSYPVANMYIRECIAGVISTLASSEGFTYNHRVVRIGYIGTHVSLRFGTPSGPTLCVATTRTPGDGWVGVGTGNVGEHGAFFSKVYGGFMLGHLADDNWPGCYSPPVALPCP